jgi:hypothetical protein
MVFALSKEGHELGGEGLVEARIGNTRKGGLIWQQYSPSQSVRAFIMDLFFVGLLWILFFSLTLQPWTLQGHDATAHGKVPTVSPEETCPSNPWVPSVLSACPMYEQCHVLFMW